MTGTGAYEPDFPPEHVERLRRWHEAAYAELAAAGERRMSYLGLDLIVPPGVFAPTPMSDLLGQAVLSQVREGHRVLDMGTGCGVNALLAATRTREVVGVDINPEAVAAAVANAKRNTLAGRTSFFTSDLFDEVDGTFDVVIYDPPFRWFRPRDLMEASIADEGYGSLGRFFAGVVDVLRPAGVVLVFFGSSGDEAHLRRLIDGAGLVSTTIADRRLVRDDLTVTYFALRLTR